MRRQAGVGRLQVGADGALDEVPGHESDAVDGAQAAMREGVSINMGLMSAPDLSQAKPCSQ